MRAYLNTAIFLFLFSLPVLSFGENNAQNVLSSEAENEQNVFVFFDEEEVSDQIERWLKAAAAAFDPAEPWQAFVVDKPLPYLPDPLPCDQNPLVMRQHAGLWFVFVSSVEQADGLNAFLPFSEVMEFDSAGFWPVYVDKPLPYLPDPLPVEVPEGGRVVLLLSQK